MAVKKFKPTSNSLRGKTVQYFDHLDKPAKGDIPRHLLAKLAARSGRSKGRISIRHRGGGHKRRYRVIDFKRSKKEVPGIVTAIHYDPNRSANIALIKYIDGDYRYILAAEGLRRGQGIISGNKAQIRPGNTLPLSNIPPGTTIHNIELMPGRGGQLVRAAGSFATLAGRDGSYVILKMPSGEMRKVHQSCSATIGQVGNREHNLVKLGKAGRSRWLGRRPHIRGVVMNPVDHPHGGGEGKSSGGRHPVSPWGQPAKGYKTRKKNSVSDRFIVERRARRRKKS